MCSVKTPVTLRVVRTRPLVAGLNTNSGRKVTVACLIGAASVTGAHAQEPSTSLPAVTVDPPKVRQRPPAATPSPAQTRARTALRKVARQAPKAQPAPRATPVAPVEPAFVPPTFERAADGNPYADPAAPYKVDRLSSQKFSEPLLNTPKTVTVLTKELLEDKNATTLKDAARTTAGVTLGSGEGGNAFGDRFFIRGFDARNDVFIDGVRDPGVSIRENFFTEQVEILRGPGSSFAGRGTTGGAINIVTKQAGDQNFKKIESTFGTDNTKRVTFDVNQVINPTLSVRAGGLVQGANVAGRDTVTDNRWGGFAAVKWAPTEQMTFTANYIHTDLSGIPDFGVPYYRPSTATTAGGPTPTALGTDRNIFYGFASRDFFKAQQDIGTINGEYKVNDAVTVTNKFRLERSTLNYIGTTPESPVITNPNPLLWTATLNPQSRYQTTDVIANQTDVKVKFDTGPIKNTAIAGVELSRERISIDSYTGYTSESFGSSLTAAGGVPGAYIFAPQFGSLGFGAPMLTGNPTFVTVNTKSAYLIDTANYNDFIILNGGIRYDDYSVGATNQQGSNAVENGLFNYNAGIVIKPLPIASVYAAYATSADPVGSEIDATGAAYGGLPASVPGNPTQVFGPQTNQAVEVGTKWELFDRHLLASAALFQTNTENARQTVTVGAVKNVTVAGAAYYVQGIDLEVAGKITDEWSVAGGLVLMKSKVTTALAPSADPALYPTAVGLPLANIAHQSFNVLTKYKITPMWEVGAQATYVSQIFGGTLPADAGTSIPAHWRFDSFVEAHFNKTWTAKIAVNNIFNTLYYDALYRSAAPFVLEAPGRSASLVISAKD